MDRMKNIVVRGLWTVGLASGMLLAGGCASHYYAVTDSGSGKTYYAPKVQTDKKSGNVSFVDAASGVPLTVKHPQVKTISRAAFNRAVFSQ
jgi:hypothetical protein